MNKPVSVTQKQTQLNQHILTLKPSDLGKVIESVLMLSTLILHSFSFSAATKPSDGSSNSANMYFDLFSGYKRGRRWRPLTNSPVKLYITPVKPWHWLSDDTDVTLLHKDITQTGWTDQTAEIQSKYDDIWLSAAEVRTQVNAGHIYHVYKITKWKVSAL